MLRCVRPVLGGLICAGMIGFAGCARPAHDDVVLAQTEPTSLDELRRLVDQEVQTQGANVSSLHTVFTESESAIKQSNPGKLKSVEEIRRMFVAMEENEHLRPRLLVQVKSRLSQLK